MRVGLLESQSIKLTNGVSFVKSRAHFAQSVVRRFRRWLGHDRIEVHAWYKPILREALTQWGQELYLALDTSMLWERYGLIGIVVIDRGRAIPVGGEVIEHRSSSVNFETYRH